MAVAVVLLAYMCYRSVMGPIEFDKTREQRENLIKARLIDIRKAQIEYKNIHKVHAANFDELSKFLKDEKLLCFEECSLMAFESDYGCCLLPESLINVIA